MYGCAKFSCLADAQRGLALARQVEEYVAASPSLGGNYSAMTGLAGVVDAAVVAGRPGRPRPRAKTLEDL